MDYIKHYNNLMFSRLNRPLIKEIGYEFHHFIPKCMGGSDAQNNLVKLTYREHYIAHKLLAKAFPENSKLIYAFLCMLRPPNGKDRNLSSRQIAYTKKMFAEFKSKEWKINNPMFKEPNKRKASARMKENNPLQKEPWKNHTAKAVKVFWEHKRPENFKYLKEISVKYNIPYVTLKILKRENRPSKKHKILSIVEI